MCSPEGCRGSGRGLENRAPGCFKNRPPKASKNDQNSLRRTFRKAQPYFSSIFTDLGSDLGPEEGPRIFTKKTKRIYFFYVFKSPKRGTALGILQNMIFVHSRRASGSSRICQIQRILSAERGAQPQTTRAGGQDGGSSNKLPQIITKSCCLLHAALSQSEGATEKPFSLPRSCRI